MINIEALSIPALIVFFSLATYFTIQKAWMSLLGLLIISFGMNAFTALGGTLWFPYKAVMIPIFIYTVFNLKWLSAVDILKAYFFLLILSLAVAWITAPNISGITFLQGPTMRPLVQLYTYAGMGIIVVFVAFVVNSHQRLAKTLFLYFRLSEIIIAIGLIHLVFIILGLEFIPILRPGGEHSLMAAFGYEETVINRIYGISGEPKSLATFVLPYIFISTYNYLEHNYNINRLYHIASIVVGTIVMIYTFSSALLMSAAIAIPTISYLFRHRIKKGVLSISLLIGFIAFIFGEVGESFLGSNNQREIIYTEAAKQKYSWSDILYERSFGRVENEVDERFEKVALDYITKEKPIFLLTGFGLGMYNYHLPLPKHGRGLEPIDSGWVVILLDMGILGLLYFFTVYRFAIKLRNENKLINNLYLNSYIIGLLVGLLAHLGNNALYQIFLFLGLALAAYNVSYQQKVDPA